MMKLKKLSMLCLAASALTTTSAMAWESADGAWSTSANVTLATEYMWRGQALTDSDPAIQGGFDLGHASGLYAGVWGSNIEADGGTIELDYYAGYSADIGDTGFAYDVGVLYYDFPGIEDFDYFEVYGFLSYGFLSAGVSYSLDAFDADYDGAEDNLYYQLDASYDVGSVSLGAGVGYYDYDDEDIWGESYGNWYISASTELAGLGFALTFTDVDSDGEDNGHDDQVVFSISKSL